MRQAEDYKEFVEILGKITGQLFILLILVTLVAMCGYVFPPMVGLVLYGWDWWAAALLTVTVRGLLRLITPSATVKVN